MSGVCELRENLWLSLRRLSCRGFSRLLRCGGYFLLILGSVFTSAFAEERGSIHGIVQRQGQGIAEHRIMLIRFGPDQDVQRTPGKTDAQGRFSFDNLATGGIFEYVVGIRYTGQLYRGESIRLQSGQRLTNVVVEVTQTLAPAKNAPPNQLTIANHLMLIVLRDDRLEVREIIRLFNPEKVAPTGRQERFSLHLPLPQGYVNLMDIQGLDTKYIHLEESGLYYTAPLDAGVHRIVYTYALPFREKLTTILVERSLPTALLDLLVQDTELVATSDLRFEGRVPFEPHTFFHFRGTDLPPQTRSWLQITRRSSTLPFLQVATYSVIIGVVIFGVMSSFFSVRRSPAQREVELPLNTAQEAQALKATSLRLLQTIAQLDDRHEAGTIDTATYQQQRETYKNQLFELYEQIHPHHQQDTGAPIGGG
ncbi:MAG: carboxypeptidase-like regulatory domain-containing protein [Candidatus Tectomicrobia bacterium]